MAVLHSVEPWASHMKNDLVAGDDLEASVQVAGDDLEAFVQVAEDGKFSG